MKVQKIIEVWLARKRLPRPIDLVQFDTGIQLVFTVQDFTIPDGTTATLYVQKPSGKFVYQETGITVADNTITIDLENQAITEHGNDIPYQVRLKNGTDLITTFAGIFRVEKSLADVNAEESKTVIAAFEAKMAEQIAKIEAETLDQIANLQAASQTEQEAIENKGLEVLNTIPADYTATAAMAETANRSKADAVVCVAEGDSVVVGDASADPLRGLKLFGKTTQNTTTGAQLFDSGAIGANLYTAVSNDGVITIDMDNTDGTSDKYATFYTPVSGLLKESTQYAVVAEVFSTNGNGGTVYLTSHYSEELSQFDDTASLTNPAVGVHVKLAKTASTFDACRYMCRGFVSCPAGKHLKVSLRVSVLADTSITDKTFVYEPFSGGNPAPNPEYPQNLNSVGSSGSIIAKVSGANLFDVNNATFREGNGLTGTINADGSVTVNGTPTGNYAQVCSGTIKLPKGKYFVSGGENAAGCAYFQLYANKTDGSQKYAINGVFVVDGTEVGDVHYSIQSGNNLDPITNFTLYPMFNVGEVQKPFEPYKNGGTMTIQTESGIPGIPVASGGNYTDANGQQWICDEVDLERGVYVQRVENRQVLSSDNWETMTAEGRYWLIEDGFYNVSTSAFCTHFIKADGWANHTLTDGTFILHRDPSWNDGRLSFKDTAFASLDEWKQFLDANEVYVLYELATPIETALTADEIQAFKALHSNHLNTTVLNDAGAWMQVKYNADLKKYFEKCKEYVTPEMYGAKGDGTTDDSQAFNAMLASGIQSIVLSPNKSYCLKSELSTFDGVTVNLNGSVIKTFTTIKLGDFCTILNGTISEQSRTGNYNLPAVLVEGTHTNLVNISFTSKEEVYGAVYIKTATDSDLCNIKNCHFDGMPQVGIYLCGNRCTIEDCYFDDITHPESFATSYSNCLKLSAEDCLDDTTPCARNTIARNCYFGFQSDNCIDCFAGADGLVVEDCVFNNGGNVAMEIKNQFRSTTDASFSAGTSLAGKRICRNIYVNNCEFLGTQYMFVASVTASSDYTDTIEPVYNLQFTNCRMPNITKEAIAIGGDMVKDVVVDNLSLTGLTTTTYLYMYGENTTLKNINNEYLQILVHGTGRIDKCKVSGIQAVNANADVEISQCSDYGTSGPFILVTACLSAVVHDCSVLSKGYLIGLNGSPTLLCVRNNIAKSIINNGYANAGGKVYILNNLYKNVLMPSADNDAGIAYESGNVKIS